MADEAHYLNWRKIDADITRVARIGRDGSGDLPRDGRSNPDVKMPDQSKAAYTAAMSLYAVLKTRFGDAVLVFKRDGIPTVSLENPYASLKLSGRRVKVSEDGQSFGEIWRNNDRDVKAEAIGEGMIGFFSK